MRCIFLKNQAITKRYFTNLNEVCIYGTKYPAVVNEAGETGQKLNVAVTIAKKYIL